VDPTLIGALDRGDVSVAVEWIRTEDDPARVLAMFHGAIRHAYWSRKDLTAVVALGEAAFAFGRDFPGDPLLGMVKAIAFDVGSFCWIGWDEPGIAIDSAAMAAGASAAAFNLALAERLDRPSGPRAAAHWLVGAHELAAGRRDEAVRCFEESARHARRGSDLGAELLALGYIAIARGEEPDTDAFAGVEDGDEYVAQLRTAARVFASLR
jgi:hypothetical protein